MPGWDIDGGSVYGADVSSRASISLSCALRASVSFFLFCSVLKFSSLYCCSTLLNLFVIGFLNLRVASLALDSWVLDVDVDSTYKALSDKDLTKIDSFPSVRPDAADSVSG